MGISTLFVSSNQRNSGSIVVTMGLMELLRSKIANVAFFRPVIESAETGDHDIMFMREYFSLPQSFEESYALTFRELEALMAAGKLDEAIETVIAKFRALQARNGFVLVEGMAMPELSLSAGEDLNLVFAKNLDADVASIVNGKNKSKEEILAEISIESETIKSQGARVFMIIANRISPDILGTIDAAAYPAVSFAPEIEELERVSIGEIKEQLGCEILFGSADDLNRVVDAKLAAAMSVENYLQRLRKRALIIVPSDRSDILAATVLALYSKSYPHVAGIVLSGNLQLSWPLKTLLQGLEGFSLPILTSPYDTYQCVSRIDAIKPKIYPSSDRKIALALGLFHEHVDTAALLSRLQSSPEHTITPVMFQYTLFEKARTNKKRIVLPESEDERILRAADMILRRGVAELVLLGDAGDIHHRAGLLGLDLSRSSVIDPAASELRETFAEEFFRLRSHKGLSYESALDVMGQGSYFGTMLVHMGLADGMVSGASHTTADTIRPALQIIKTKPGISIVSSVFFMCLDTRVLVYGDCAVNQNPTAEELAQIAATSAETARAFGIEPRVAMLSYSTGESGSGEEVEKVKAATRSLRQSHPELLVEGPIQYDAAVDSDVASLKLPHSAVAGKATVFVFPDLNTGNNTYKAVQRSAGAVAIGPVLQGLNKPVNDLSRGCSVEDVINTIAITAIQAGGGQ